MTMASDMYAHCCGLFRAFLLSLVLTVPITSIASAHVGVTVPFVEVPDPASITIDGDDERLGFFRSPVSLLDREGFFDRESDYVDAADFDFTIYTAWSPPPDNSWYCFARISDDTLKIENEDPLKWWQRRYAVDYRGFRPLRRQYLRIHPRGTSQRPTLLRPGIAVETPAPAPRSSRLSRPAPRPFLRGISVGDAQTPLRHCLDDAPARRGQRHFARRIYLRVESGLVGCAGAELRGEPSGTFSRRGRHCTWDSGCSMPTGRGRGASTRCTFLGGHQHQDRNADRMPDFRTITLDEAQNWRMPAEQDAVQPSSADGE